MKSRLFKVIIAAEFEDEHDHRIIADAIMRALQSEGVPRGRAQVLAEALHEENYHLPRQVLDRLN